MTEFARVPQLSTRIATHLQTRIEAETWPPGTRLPTEAKMMQEFGVSRAVIREAIAQLRNAGLVETRQGAGAFVAAPGARPIRLEPAQTMDRRAFAKLYELRTPLEVEAAGLAAQNARKPDLARLAQAMARFDVPEESIEASVAADLEFHHAIALATQNPYFVQVLAAISDRIAHVIRAARAEMTLADLHARTRSEHGAICAAITTRDPQAARAAMRAHMAGGAARIGLRHRRGPT